MLICATNFAFAAIHASNFSFFVSRSLSLLGRFSLVVLCRFWFAVSHFPSLVRRFSFAVSHSPFLVRRFSFAISHSPSLVRRFLFSICRLPFLVRCFSFTVSRSPFSLPVCIAAITLCMNPYPVSTHPAQNSSPFKSEKRLIQLK